MTTINTSKSFDDKAIELYKLWLDLYHDEHPSMPYEELAVWFGKEVATSIKQYLENKSQLS